MHSLTIVVDADNSLSESWEAFANMMQKAGAASDQINMMQLAYYLGAAQVFTCVEEVATTDRETFNAAMREMHKDIDAVLERSRHEGGHA
jgi:hypothetical protein